MKKVSTLVLAALVAPLAGCSGGGGGNAPVVSVLDYSPEVTPGSNLYVQTDRQLLTTEVRIGGTLISGTPLLTYANGFGAIFELPDTLPIGTTQLAVRAKGESADTGVVALEVVEPVFRDVAPEIGLQLKHDITGWPADCAESLTGIACADYDGDGDPDFFVGNIGSEGKLMRNEGDLDFDGLPDFVDATAAAGVDGFASVAGVSFMDYDNDGDKDLFLSRRGPNRLLQNQLVESGGFGVGAATFTDVTLSAGLGMHDQRTMGVGWGDYDGDGDLDLYVVNHAFCFPTSFGNFSQDRLYRNDGGTFEDVTYLLGGPSPATAVLGFSAIFIDYDGDLDQDILVINDHVLNLSGPNVLWRNDGPTGPGGEYVFTDVSVASGFGVFPDTLGKGVNAMGASIGDVNRDGFPDIAFSNIGPNYLLINDGAGGFVDASDVAGIRRTWLPWGNVSITWGTNLFDYDNDMDLDLFYAGGEIKDQGPMPHAFFEQQPDGTFVDATWRANLNRLGHGKASALIDLDRDGWPELAVASWASDLTVFRNRSADLGNANHWLAVDLQGTVSNRDAIGSKVEVTTPDGITQTAWRTCRPSLSTGSELTSFFGLGANTQVTSLSITWPDGTVTQPMPPAVDTRMLVVEPTP